MDYTIKIGGAAGQGIQTIGESLSRVFSRSGFHLFSYQDYESRVRGGHNFYQVRFADRAVLSPRDPVDVLIALDTESIELHGEELSDVGSAIYDSEYLELTYDDPRFVDVPFKRIALEAGGSDIMANTVATSAVLGMLGMEVSALEGVLEDTLKRHPETVEANIKAARAGYAFGSHNCPRCSFSVPPPGGRKMVIEGNQAVGFAAIASGCKFYSAYPMTPSTGIMAFLANHAVEHGILVEQAEDEIAAINMALGASFAGVRAMTGTSGGGFALMVEGLSLAGMTETPIVVVLAQRPGPATGLPTRTEQADLLFALHAGHGEVPRVVFAPGTPEQAFRLVSKAFDLTEKYQVPAIVLTDQHYADSTWSVDAVDLSGFKHVDYRIRGDAFKGLSEYKRHALTDTGVSPLAVPGDSKHLVVTDSDEHDEAGHLIEDARTRIKMVEKRYLRKMPLIREEIEPPMLYGSDAPDITLVCWGSNYGVVREAVDDLSTNHDVAMLHFSELFPFPADDSGFMDTIRGSRLAVCIENNVSGRFARLIRAETGFEFSERINRFDGRPFTLEGLLEGLDVYL
jgi:2-oxoglutarate/2-oxoacid ferredoxin oxidoreductase subunit alpha